MTELQIDHVGRKGDGVSLDGGQEIYVPFTLAGERIEVTGSGPRRDPVKIIEQSPNRADPACTHFGTCGGCQLQHIADDAYQSWKMPLVTEPLAKIGVTLKPEPMITFPNGSRRKVVFSAKQTSTELLFGFQERAGNTVINVSQCPVTASEIMDRLDDLRDLTSSVPGAKVPLRVSVLSSRNGLDIDIEDARDLSGKDRQILVRKSVDMGFARLAVNGETLVESKKSELVMGSCVVVPPPGAFVQAIEDAELAMVQIVMEHLKSCKTVADLYCGVGTFALRLAEKSTVLAIESSAPALAALDLAWRATAGKLKQLNTEVRNLERRPMSFKELKHINGVVFDPPRAGAELQAKQIAKSRVTKVAAVSCNPVTLARDLEILITEGFKVTRIVPIDQFRYTPHIEVVALLER